MMLSMLENHQKMSFHTNNGDKAIKMKANQTNERLALKKKKIQTKWKSGNKEKISNKNE